MWIDDQILLKAAQPMALELFVPTRSMVVLGSSNVAEAEAAVESCERAGVPILKRYGGGGTVLLHDGCVVASIGLWVRQHFQNRLYFGHLNQAIIDALASVWPALAMLGQRGLSDITAEDRKIAGTSLFRSRNYLLYQASILVDARIDLLEAFLKHPTREPDYRKGRGHRGFVAGLAEIVDEVTPQAALAALKTGLAAALVARLDGELIAPQADQIPGLLKRAQSPDAPPP